MLLYVSIFLVLSQKTIYIYIYIFFLNYQSNTFLKIMPKLVLKTEVGDYGFNFKLKTVDWYEEL